MRRAPRRAQLGRALVGSTPVVGVTLGCPCGIGPEVVARALGDEALRRRARWRVFGDPAAWEAALSLTHTPAHAWPAGEGAGAVVLEPCAFRGSGRSPPWQPGKPNAKADASCAQALGAALGAAQRGELHAVATGPARKQAFVNLSGGPFPGHTQLFHHALGVAAVPVMLFVAPGMRLALHTIHVPLKKVASQVTASKVLQTLHVLVSGLAEDLGLALPRVEVLGLNPHAGEDGLLGSEDSLSVAVAVKRAQALGMDVHGPFPADGVFANWPTRRDRPAALLAMYHDQGLAPFKLWEQRRGCQITLGLRVPRTSCDHGTAYTLAGRGQADFRSMHAAMALAVRVAQRRAKGSLNRDG